MNNEVNEHYENQGNQGAGFGIASLVLGIVTWVLFWIPFVGQILPILAIVFGIIGLKRPGKAMGIAGLVLGAISLFLKILGFIVLLLAFDEISSILSY